MLPVLLGIVGFVQLIRLADADRILLLERIWQFRSLSAEDRSAIFFSGRDFQAYIEFVGTVVPEDATIIIPREEPTGIYSHLGVMGFYLIPRRLINCNSTEYDEVERCVGEIEDPNTYVMAVSSFPPPELGSRRLEYVPFDELRGLYVPPGSWTPQP